VTIASEPAGKGSVLTVRQRPIAAETGASFAAPPYAAFDPKRRAPFWRYVCCRRKLTPRFPAADVTIVEQSDDAALRLFGLLRAQSCNCEASACWRVVADRQLRIAWLAVIAACARTPRMSEMSERTDAELAFDQPGRRTVNTDPLPGSLATVTSPPIMRASLRVMARPRPVPP
jgi:hypothetical protein